MLALTVGFAAEIISFDNNWAANPLFNVVSETPTNVEVIFSMHKMVIEEILIDGIPMKTYGVPGIHLPNDEGAPNLASTGRYIALPQGARARVTILNARTAVYHDVEVAPAPNIPREDDDSPLRYEKNMTIYNRHAYYPDSPVRLSEPMKMRGVDVVILGIMPFQYNPVTKELIVYKDLRVRVDFVGGNGHFGEDRLRSRFWEPILQGHLLNYNSLPEIDFYAPERMQARYGYEYVIIVPDDPVFEAWADTIKLWRQLQGISCDVFTLTEVGGTSASAIEGFLNNAYTTWDVPPAAFLLLSDYNPSGDDYGITSPVYNDPFGLGSCVSDNIYADVDGDYLPDMHHARIPAQDEEHLSIIINKFLNYERNPYTATNFYNEPLMACGWQTSRWFQLCVEVIRGFFITSFGKDPQRQYAIYEGTPVVGGPWSTAGNTTTVVNYWYAVGWLPSLTNPYDQTWWSGGNAAGMNAAINSGAFLVQHRDHGNESSWGEPNYSMSHLNNLTNDMFPFVYSSNCLTGKFNHSGEVFAERFLRLEHGALGLNAATEVSYSFVNDTYVWGMYDGLWSHFDPGYSTFDATGYNNLRPCQAMSYGKYYLQTSSWTGATAKPITYHLFHHLGDAFNILYTEIPLYLTVTHAPKLTPNQTSFDVTADDSSIIALTVNGEIIGVVEGTGSSVTIPIAQQTVGDVMIVTVTKANHYRYEAHVPVVPENYAWVVMGTTILDDAAGNNDGTINPGETIDYGVYAKNIGTQTAQSVHGILSESDPFVIMNTDSSWYGTISVDDSIVSNPYYNFSVVNNCPDDHKIQFTLEFYDSNDSTWIQNPELTVYAPVLTYQDVNVVGGYWDNGVLDPGETVDLVVTIMNEGHAIAEAVTSTLSTNSSYITVIDASGAFGTIDPSDTVDNAADSYTVMADSITPLESPVDFSLIVESGVYIDTLNFSLIIGRFPPSDTGYYYAFFSGGPHARSPVFEWIAIDTTQTVHPGVSLNLDLNQTAVIPLPFTFKYYGVDYDRISISSNGWLAMDSTTSTDFTNSGIPNADGPPAMIAGVWDFLHPGIIDAAGDVYYYHDAQNHRFIVEYFRVDHYPSGYPETFEILLYDPAYYPTPTGDGEIVVQYLLPLQRPGSTLGIENWEQTVGVQYYYDGTYHENAGVVTDSFAIKYTTHDPNTGVEESAELSILPTRTMLRAPYPNPFTRQMRISYQLSKNSRVKMHVYDASGRFVRTLFDGIHNPGYYTLIWDSKDEIGRAVAAGIYFIHFVADEYEKVEKAVLLK